VATITSTQTGDYDLTSTWVGGIVPVAGDDVVIASTHTVTVTDTRACTLLTIYGDLTISSIGILGHSGNVLHDPTTTGDGLVTIEGGGKIYPTVNNLSWTFDGTNSLYAKIITSTTSITNWAIFGDSGGNRVYFVPLAVNQYTDHIAFDCPFMEWHYVDDGTAYFINNGQQFGITDHWVFDDGYFNHCGTIRFGGGATPNSALIFSAKRCHHQSPSYTNVIEYASDDAIVAYRGWEGSTVVGNGTTSHKFYISGAPSSGTINLSKLVSRDCGINNLATALVDASDCMLHQVYDSGSSVFVSISSLVNVGGSDFTNLLIHTDNTNAHTVSASGTSTNENSVQGSRLFSSHAGSNLMLYRDKVDMRYIMTKGGTGPWTTAGSSNVQMGNSLHLNPPSDIRGGIGFETIAYTGTVDCVNNICIKQGTTFGYIAIALSPITTQVLNIVGHNCWYNLTGTYSNIATITNDQTANDINEDPAFVDIDVDFASWDLENGGAGTVTNAFDEAIKKNGRDKTGALVAFDTNYTHTSAKAHIDNGITPTNVNLQGTGYLGVDIGPVAVVPASSFQPAWAYNVNKLIGGM